MRLTEQLTTRKRALIGGIAVDPLSGAIPPKHRDQPVPEMLPKFVALNLRIQEAGLKTQNCDKGMDRFVRKFNPGTPMEATIAVGEGVHGEQIWAVCATQESRRCLLLDTLLDSTGEEAL
jgi:hypothetical protein